ncbi:hypothetical protein HY091_02360 [Candidatus Kaiserbacteria bacterium]|nr:hypothetical protein [Candidatus Kaiserbacteria bacterium]
MMERQRNWHVSKFEQNAESPLVAIARQVDEESARLDADTAVQYGQMQNSAGVSPHDLELKAWGQESFPLKERTGEINDQPIHFLGVVHTPETLLFQRKRIEEAIASAGAVVLEGAPEIAGVYDLEFLQKVKDRLHTAGSTEGEAEGWVHKSILDNPPIVFFREMEQLAKKHQKLVITIDPHSGADKDRELILEWAGGHDRLSEDLGAFDIGLLGVWATAVGASAGTLAWNQLKTDERRRFEKHQPDFVEKNPELVPKPSRRQFLAGVAGLAATAPLAPSVLSSASGSSSPYTIPFDFLDYRNVSVARGIDKLTRARRFDGPILFIYGASHADPMMTYLHSPELRDTKYALYSPARAVKQSETNIYEFAPESKNDPDPTHYRWKKILSQSR